jgi:hypothetical protein
MTQGIGSTAVSQSYEMLGAALAKNQQKQEGQMMMQLLQSASTAAPAQQSSSYGNLGQNINIQV